MMTMLLQRLHAWCAGLANSGCLAIALTVAACALLPTPAAAQTNTAAILTDTVSALPACIKWKPTGVCFWLKCRFIKCSVVSSFRIQHYVPDAIVSTYHDPLNHPWGDVGRVVATASSSLGSALLATPLDSAGSSTKPAEIYNSRDADVIGNPVGLLANVLAGQSFSFPNSVRYPGVNELSNYPGTVGSILSSWSSVPSQFAQAVQSAKLVADLPNLAGKVTQVATIANRMRGVSNLGANLGQIGQLPNMNIAQLGNFVNAIGASGFTSSAIFCPGSASVFGLYFQSEIDSYFWRGLIPTEMLYPASWVPGLAETSDGFPQTWGGIYPRNNDLHQVQGVKASAVLANRVLSIVSQSSQPHVYTKLEGDYSGFRMFETGGSPVWQRLYPNAEPRCGTFGANDSLWLTSWGDGNTSSGEGYVWNVWRRYECCQKAGQIFLSSVHW